MSRILIIYLIVVNIIAFVMYGADKHKAKKGKWRISEKALICIAVIGGSIGALFGMYIFRHKTKHGLFRYGIPCILIAQSVLVCFLIRLFWVNGS